MRRGGRLVCVGLPAAGVLPIPVFALHAAGRTRVIAATRKLDDVNDSFAEVLSGAVPARLVIEF
ncbi:hypothetical protein [Saccharothrix texasensis]|uniref:hypothetical protein n=1 Tax=Saccharothrix texasensis TaxID=103734 RepID=UPI001B880425|nr:hypothetical protein [Saccharothrix texasensis]